MKNEKLCVNPLLPRGARKKVRKGGGVLAFLLLALVLSPVRAEEEGHFVQIFLRFGPATESGAKLAEGSRVGVATLPARPFVVSGSVRATESDSNAVESALEVEGVLKPAKSGGFLLRVKGRYTVFFGEGAGGADITGRFSGETAVAAGKEKRVAIFRISDPDKGEDHLLEIVAVVD
ncbi:MAG: hypothetical protein D6679_02345 [Candidatus Hydrogenedentota bacterium]|nr:MAG: hypothetical protein D6679_02345 [Candidatus Hydrogenedentota bacterium]